MSARCEIIFLRFCLEETPGRNSPSHSPSSTVKHPKPKGKPAKDTPPVVLLCSLLLTSQDPEEEKRKKAEAKARSKAAKQKWEEDMLEAEGGEAADGTDQKKGEEPDSKKKKKKNKNKTAPAAEEKPEPAP